MNEAMLYLAKEWFLLGLIKFGSFKLKSGAMSNYYIDFGPLRSNTDAMHGIVEFLRFNDEFDLFWDLIADVPTRITPLVSILSYVSRIPMITPRLDNKTYGSGNKIEGVFKEGQRVLLIDDVITTADSKLQAIEILKSNGLDVTDVFVMVDREQGGRERLEKAGYKLRSIFTTRKLLDSLLFLDLITEDQFFKSISQK